MLHGLATFFLIAILLLSCACKKSPQQRERPPEDLYRVDRGAATVAPKNLVHKTFQLPKYAKFEFEVPAHSISPKLQGTFKAFQSGNPDAAANIDVLLLTTEQFDDFIHGRPGEAGYSLTGTSGQTVDYALPSTLEQPQKYYLVFRNPARQGTALSVAADFTASF